MGARGSTPSIVDGMKRCTACGETKPVDDFHLIGAGPRRNSWCRPCKQAKKLEMRARLQAKPRDDTIEARFWPKVDKRGPDECWNWLGALSNRGYGAIMYKGKDSPAHRVMMELEGHTIDYSKGQVVDHMCKNIRCVNPRHLRICTQIENTTIYADRSRQHKLTPEVAAEIRRRYRAGESPINLALEYGIRSSHVCGIGKGKVWKSSVLERFPSP